MVESMKPSSRRLMRGIGAVALVALLAGSVSWLSYARGQRPEPADTPAVSGPGGDVCPPFFLLDESGEIINPVAGINTGRPYSPRQTCGACHDYDLITEGYHFTQGAGEAPTADQKKRFLWASAPGNFGGNWCSPAPLYRYLSSKHNESAATMDMTAFTFFTSACGVCHPGGGPGEFDREGRRYDVWIDDPASGFVSGGDNNFDGDYYRARWSETGVLEADCLLCHLPGYDYGERQDQLANWNFRWAATAGSGLAEVGGSVRDGVVPEVVYDPAHFNPDGTIEPPMVRSPRNEACLSCHAQPGWKKRGANFRARTDVHLRAGLRCVDCHPAGSSATDPRIAGHEVHQFGKGDDPGGLVRNDLNNTLVSCRDCHDTGRLGAPLAEHRGLPPLHLERISCQACHIPERIVMPIQLQASDVFNPAPKIYAAGKKLWTFYGVDGKWRNHYGYLEMMGYDDKPTERFQPVLALYKGQIYPVNRVHSAWPGIEIEGQEGLMQPRMGDIFRMWTAHQENPTMYPSLARIVDDSGDGVPEVNRPEEIDALIEAVTQMLADIDYPMEGKRVVWVSNERVYRSGTEYRTIEKHDWEASPFANVHKYSHDILPGRAALGSKGCTECHSLEAPFFFASVVQRPFDERHAEPVTVAQYELLGISRSAAVLGAVRETYVKPVLYLLWLVLAVLFIAWLVGLHAAGGVSVLAGTALGRVLPWVLAVGLGIALLPMLLSPPLREYVFPSRLWLDHQHFLVAAATFAVGVVGLLGRVRSGRGDAASRVATWVMASSLLTAMVCGLLMALSLSTIHELTRYAYTAFDLALVVIVVVAIVIQLRAITLLTGEPGEPVEPPGRARESRSSE